MRNPTLRAAAICCVLISACLLVTSLPGQSPDSLVSNVVLIGPNLKPVEIPAGNYQLITVYADGRTPSTVQFSVDGPGPSPVPVPTPNPIPNPTPNPTPSTIVSQVKAEVEKIPAGDSRNTIAVKLAGTYQLIAGKVRSGEIPHDSIRIVINGVIQVVTLGNTQWNPVVEQTLGFVATCSSPSACADILDQCAAGFLATIPAASPGASDATMTSEMKASGLSQELANAAEVCGFDWAKWLPIIMQLIMSIIAMF